MQYVLSALAVAIVLAAVDLSREVGSEYFAKYLTDQETSDFGVSEAVAPPVALPSAPPSDPAIGHVQPILFSGAIEPMPAVFESPLPEPVEPAGGSEPDAPSRAGDLDWIAPLLAPAGGGARRDAARAESTDEAVVDARAFYAASGDQPYRRADGTVFVPLSTQRLFALRTLVTRQEGVSVIGRLAGRVTPGAEGSAVTSALSTGIVEPAEGRFPYVGMPVQAGTLLAHLRPTFSAVERAEIEARMQHLINEIALASSQIARLQEVMLVRYRANKIAELEMRIEGLRAELATLSAVLEGRQPLRAPIDGVVWAVHAVPNGTVEMGSPVVEIVDPRSPWVEVAVADPALARQAIGAAAHTAEGALYPLELMGIAPAVDGTGVTMRFRIAESQARGAEVPVVGSGVAVFLRGVEGRSGVALPASSIVEDASGARFVWERIGAELFVPRQVEAEPLIDGVALVTAGLGAGIRIVTDPPAILAAQLPSGAATGGETES